MVYWYILTWRQSCHQV